MGRMEDMGTLQYSVTVREEVDLYIDVKVKTFADTFGDK